MSVLFNSDDYHHSWFPRIEQIEAELGGFENG